ncbi:MAG TPA: iron-sulfur cluster assembly accessory protein [Cyanobacteria bacterium UBA8156]|jgi:iron-sulfur cluster assembly protein|nr:iron-sulfur cluster assembly accessory protein [Cyanobacteria bacterium UBA8156]
MEITTSAQNKLRSLLPQPDRAFRLKALAGGCKGYTYDLKIIRQPTPDDVLQPGSDLLVYVDRASLPHLEAVVMDYVEGLIHSGFSFHHPSSCSCGKSFSPDTCPSS